MFSYTYTLGCPQWIISKVVCLIQTHKVIHSETMYHLVLYLKLIQWEF